MDIAGPASCFLYVSLHYITLAAKSRYSPSPLDEAASAILLIPAIIYLITKKDFVPFTLFSSYILMLVFSGAQSTYGGVEQPKAAITAALLDAKLPIFIWAFSYAFNSMRHPTRLLVATSYAFITFATINLPFVLHDYARGVDIFGGRLSAKGGIIIPNGLFHAATELAWLYCMAAFCSLCLFMYKRKLAYLICSATFSAVLLLTLSTKEIAAFLISAVIVFRPARRDWSDVAVKYLVGAAATLVILSSTDLGGAIVKHVGMFIGDHSIPTVRAGMTEASWRIAADDFPLGAGGGTFGSAPSYQNGYSNVYYAYNIHLLHGGSREFAAFLQDVFWAKIVGESGWIGFACYALFLIVLINRMLNAIKSSNIGGEIWDRFSVSSVILLLMVSLASSPFTNELLLLVAGVAFGYSSRIRPALSSHAKTPRNM